MFDYSVLAIDIESLLYTPAVNLAKARDILAFFEIQKKAEAQRIFPETVKEQKSTMSARIALAVDRKEFVFNVLNGDFDIDGGQSGYVLAFAEATLKDIFCWARGTYIHIPDQAFNRVCSIDSDTTVGISDALGTAVGASEEILSGDEKQELGRLRREQEKWNESIQAAIKAGWHYSHLKEGERITRDLFVDYLHQEGHKTLPSTTIDKIWKALPATIKNQGGRPKGAKDVH